MKAKLVVVLSIAMLAVIYISKTKNSALMDRDSCSVSSLNWMEVTEQYDEKTVANLAATFEAAINADVSKLKGITKGDGSGKMKFIFSRPTAYSNTRTAKVSQDFYETAFSWRQAVCNIERNLKNGNITDPDVHKLAEKSLIDLSVQFGNVKTKEEKHSVSPDNASISFSANGAAQDLAIRSTLQQYADWSAKESQLFDILPVNGTIKPGGSTAVRIQPKVSVLSTGHNVEEVWFEWKEEHGKSGRFSVTLTAFRLPILEYKVTNIDDQLILKLNGVEVVRTIQTSGWTPIPSPFLLNSGNNEIEIQVFNAQTNRNNILGRREGWRYSLALRVGQEELQFSGHRDEPPPAEWGATFTVERVNIVVDANSGDASFSTQ